MTHARLALLTAPGKAAIATLALRGPGAWEVTRLLFQPQRGELPIVAPPHRHWFGRLGGDEVILAVKDDGLEIHCHGGVEVVRLIEELYQQQGITVVPWRELQNDSPALLDMLVHAPTVRTAGILLDQWQGAWTEPNRLDWSRLEQLRPLGEHLVEPWRVVIAGAPNVGKSSLMNALAGYTRSIVAATPGTTRDVVSTLLAIDGWPVELSDTAGIRAQAGPLEQQGIERARQAIEAADLRIWLLDGAADPVFPEDDGKWNYVINKADLPAAWDWQRAGQAPRISAATTAGLAELCVWISACLVPLPPQPGEAVPVLPEHREWIRSRQTPAGGRP